MSSFNTSGSHELATTPVYGRRTGFGRDSDSIRSASQSPAAVDPSPAIKKLLRCHYAQEAKSEGAANGCIHIEHQTWVRRRPATPVADAEAGIAC